MIELYAGDIIKAEWGQFSNGKKNIHTMEIIKTTRYANTYYINLLSTIWADGDGKTEVRNERNYQIDLSDYSNICVINYNIKNITPFGKFINDIYVKEKKKNVKRF